MAKVSVFAKLAENFRMLYQDLKCCKCKRKIDLQSKCTSCEEVFCTECRYQIKKTNVCEACNSIDTVVMMTNRNQFIDDLLDLICMFDNDTGLKIVENQFLNVETAENLERIFEKEKTNMLNRQKFIATSTPNVNTKKVVFNSDITMIPQNSKDAASKQVESVEKVNSKKKATEKSLSNSKRKADSMSEKSDESSKTKKVKTVDLLSDEDEISKENLNEMNEMEADNQPINDKQNSQKKCSTLQNINDDQQERIKKNISLQNKQFEEQIKRLEDEKELTDDKLRQLEQTNKQIKEQIALLEEQKKLMKNQNDQLEERNKQFETDRKQLEEINRQLDGKIKLMVATKDLEEKSIQTIKEQMKEQVQEINDTMNKGISTISQAFGVERMQEMIIVGLSKIVSNTEQAITSSIEFDQIGKINFTIEPFRVLEREKAKMRDLEMQTDEKVTGQIYVQTETALRGASQSSNNALNESISKSHGSVSQEVRQVVNNVVDESIHNGKHQSSQGMEVDLKPTNTTTNGNRSNNLSIQFDESMCKEVKQVEAPTNQNGEDVIDSDELKKHVDKDSNQSMFDSESDFDDLDEVGASSPIY